MSRTSGIVATVRVSLTLEESLNAAAERIARSEGITLDAYISRLIRVDAEIRGEL